MEKIDFFIADRMKIVPNLKKERIKLSKKLYFIMQRKKPYIPTLLKLAYI